MMDAASIPPKQSLRDAWVLLALCLLTVMAAQWMVPTMRSAERRPLFQLEQMIPSTFGNWKSDPDAMYQVVDPEREAVLKQVYQQTLSRTYSDGAGHMVMLSIAYGEQQIGSYQGHLPDICYPAQGFRVLAKRHEQLQLPQAHIPVTRLETVFNDVRYEDVTYWLTVGDRVVSSIGYDKRMEQLRYALRREIPDGLIFRVSSIGTESGEEFARQDLFVRDLMIAVPPSARQQIAGF